MQFNLIDGWDGDQRERNPFGVSVRVYVAPHYVEVEVLDAAGAPLAANRTEHWHGQVQVLYWDAVAVRQDAGPQQAVLVSAIDLNRGGWQC